VGAIAATPGTSAAPGRRETAVANALGSLGALADRVKSVRVPAGWGPSVRAGVIVWLPRAVAAVALMAAAWAGIAYGPSAWNAVTTRARQVVATEPPPARPDAPRRTTGTLQLDSTPPARVVLDGAVRGTTPLTLEEVAAGRHAIILESPVGTVQRTVAITAGAITTVNESIFAGFLAVYSPFELTITEGTRAFHPDDRNEIMLPAGHHDLRLANRALGFEETRQVELTPGQKLTISVTPPQSTLSVTSSEAAEVWIDGARVGDTPLAGQPVSLGTHDVIARRAGGTERRLTVTVTVKPFALHIDFSKPGV
jgi:hypothetical protein